MTEKKLRELFSVWQKRLGLDNWRIEVVIETIEDNGVYMENRRSIQYNRARIRVQPYVLTNNPPEDCLIQNFTDEEVESGVIHELLHCHTLLLSAMVSDDLDGVLHRDVHRQFEDHYKRTEENMVENLAQALSRSWPK